MQSTMFVEQMERQQPNIERLEVPNETTEEDDSEQNDTVLSIGDAQVVAFAAEQDPEQVQEDIDDMNDLMSEEAYIASTDQNVGRNTMISAMEQKLKESY